jgi:pimeloyl-ACP methyl ester carboxylesterase
VPVLSIRAQYSDVLTSAGQTRMQAALPEMTVVEVPGVGHAPTLGEPVAMAAIDRFLAELSGRE